ncbi:MAG: 30S ribosomal protein S6 [Candidatus Campbellbacteria bacterium]|nr:30S ribosomal protein S6 [Candidatus Campbellbacteria bacterium]
MVEEKEIQTEIDTDADSRFYELGFHIVPQVGEAGLAKEVDVLRAMLEKNGAKIISEEWPQLMTLAYPLVRDIARTRHTCTTAYFGWVVFEALPDQAHMIKEETRRNEHILRHLLVKTYADAPVVRHPVHAGHTDHKAPEEKEILHEEKKVETAEAVVPMTTEQMDVEIEKLVV